VKSIARLGADAQAEIQGWVRELASFWSAQNVVVLNPTGRTLIVACQTELDSTTTAAVRAYASGRGVDLQLTTHLPPDHPAAVFVDSIPGIFEAAGVVAGREGPGVPGKGAARAGGAVTCD
jgi:hypothetical protein